MAAPYPRLIALYSPVMASGKTQVANVLQLSHGYRPVKFADPGKAIVKDVLMRGGASEPMAERLVEGDLKEQPIPNLGVSARRMTQTVLSEWGRNCVNPDVWVRITERRLKELFDAGQHVVIDDLRFPNEYELVIQAGGFPVRVFRPDAPPYAAHKSEGLLEGYPMLTLTNNGTLQQLRACAEDLPGLLRAQQD